jgi:gas vesicle structural protein
MATIDRHSDVALIDLVDRLLETGVVLTGDITLSVAGVDLVYVGLRALITSVENTKDMRWNAALRGGNRERAMDPAR